MNTLRRQSIAILAVSILLGVVVAAQFKNVQMAGGSVSLQRMQEINANLQRLTEENSNLKQMIGELEDKVNGYESSAVGSDDVRRRMSEELNAARMEAGLTAVTGQGILIELSHGIIGGDTEAYRLVQDVDLLRIVNELRASGAEAISINDQRIIARTEIRNIGNAIVINSTPCVAPYAIQAIGNSNTLESALMLYGGIIDRLKGSVDIRLQRVEKLSIPAYRGSSGFTHARPVVE